MIDVKIDLNKSLKSFSNRIKVRQGDVGEKMRITLTDNKFSLENQNNLQVKFEGNIRSGDYVEGIAFPYNDKAGEFVYQFKSEDVSIPGAYQRAFIRVYDESGNRISSEDIFVEVLKDADISNNQSKIYVSKLDELLEDFDDDFGEFLTGKEEDYSALDEKSKELNSELSDLKKGSNEIKNTQTEIIQSIEDNDLATKNDLETAKQESSANVIYQILGKDITEITFTLNFKNKKTNSLVENPNKARVSANNNLITPTTVLNDYSQERYNSVSEIDKNYMAIWLETANQRAQSLFEFAILEEVIRHLGVDFFELQGLTTLKDQTTFLRSKMTNIQSDIWGKGVSQKGNKFYYTTFDNRGNNWGSLVTNESNTVEKTSLIISQSDLEIYLSDSGNMYFLAYSEQTDGTLATQLYIDYVELSFKLRVSTRDVIESMIAAYHRENLATQEEAETGTDNAKAMTPLRTAQQINKKAVTIAGNQTIGGIKNFKDGLMINDVSLSTITRKVIYEADGVGGYFNAADKFTLGASGKIDKIVLLWSRVDDTAGTLLNYSWSQTVLSPDDLVVGNSYRIQMTTDNYKFVTFANESGNVTISGANENSVAPNRIYRIKRIIAYLKN